MAFLESLLAAAASKAGVAAAGAVLTVTAVGTAAVTGNLPADIQTQVDELIGAERGDGTDERGTAAADENGLDGRSELKGDNAGDNDDNAADAGVGTEVSEAATTAGEGLEGRERGEAISGAVREANGSADQGQAEERRAEAATRAEAGRANADDSAETDAEERRAAAEEKAAAGRANAGTDEGDVQAEEELEDEGSDDDRQDAQHRPEGAGAPGTDG